MDFYGNSINVNVCYVYLTVSRSALSRLVMATNSFLDRLRSWIATIESAARFAIFSVFFLSTFISILELKQFNFWLIVSIRTKKSIY